MQEAFEMLRSYPSLGDFLAYQYVTDLNYSPLMHFSEMAFDVPGPGALDGIRKCFADRGGLNDAEISRFMADRQETEFERLGLRFHSLWDRPLQLIDCQNLFCEVGKYARVRHSEINGISGRARIRQRFQANSTPITYWYPPKWGINDVVVAGPPSVSTSLPPPRGSCSRDRSTAPPEHGGQARVGLPPTPAPRRPRHTRAPACWTPPLTPRPG